MLLVCRWSTRLTTLSWTWQNWPRLNTVWSVCLEMSSSTSARSWQSLTPSPSPPRNPTSPCPPGKYLTSEAPWPSSSKQQNSMVFLCTIPAQKTSKTSLALKSLTVISILSLTLDQEFKRSRPASTRSAMATLTRCMWTTKDSKVT